MQNKHDPLNNQLFSCALDHVEFQPKVAFIVSLNVQDSVSLTGMWG